MDLNLVEKVNEYEWRVPRHDAMLVPGIFFASESLMRDMDQKAYDQLYNVACLPGIVRAAYAMPDAHWGYGFPIGGVAAFDPQKGGIISAGGVGFDISCGVRLLTTGLSKEELEPVKMKLAERLFHRVPAGVGSHGVMKLDPDQMDAMLQGGAQWAVKNGYGTLEDLERIEEKGKMAGAQVLEVSQKARERQKVEMGTLGSGNHYLEVQEVVEIFDGPTAHAFGLKMNEIVISIHCGSRGLGHQIGTDFLRLMASEALRAGITLPDRELACAPVETQVGHSYLGAMRSGINCALANRQIITHLVREVFQEVLAGLEVKLLYDVSHNTCKEEVHEVDGLRTRLFVHRKGATRAFGPGHEDLPGSLREWGQPVLVGGSMGTASYVLCGTHRGEERSFSSASHGAGRHLSRTAAFKKWRSGRQVVDELGREGIIIKSVSHRGVSEEAPGAYKDIHAVVEATHEAGLARKVVRLRPLICVKG